MEQIEIYPNPFKEEIRVSGQSRLESIRVYDITGKQILKEASTDNEHVLNTTSFSKGVYFLKLVGANGKERVEKVIKL